MRRHGLLLIAVISLLIAIGGVVFLSGCATSRPTVMGYYLARAQQVLGPLPPIVAPEDYRRYEYLRVKLATDMYNADYAAGRCPARCPESPSSIPVASPVAAPL